MAIMKKLRKITNKDNCFDVFINTKVKDVRIYPEKPYDNMINYKLRKQKKEI